MLSLHFCVLHSSSSLCILVSSFMRSTSSLSHFPFHHSFLCGRAISSLSSSARWPPTAEAGPGMWSGIELISGGNWMFLSPCLIYDNKPGPSLCSRLATHTLSRIRILAILKNSEALQKKFIRKTIFAIRELMLKIFTCFVLFLKIVPIYFWLDCGDNFVQLHLLLKFMSSQKLCNQIKRRQKIYIYIYIFFINFNFCAS